MKVVTRTARPVRLLGRGLVTLVSVAVLAVSAFGWVSVRALDRSTPTADVISAPPAPTTAEQNILLVGVDSRTDARGNPLPASLLDALHAGDSDAGGDTADTLIVVHVPAGGGRATAISVPRDSYVDLPDGLGKHKINSAYARASHAVVEQLTEPTGAGSPSSTFARPDATRATADPNDPAVQRAASAAGARATIGAVEALTGLPISHYASVNLAGFADVSQAIGGVPVCLNAPVDDSYSGLRLPAGPQEVSGAQALAFVRQRHGLPNGDLDRITRQQVFLAGATDRLLSSGTLTDPFALQRLTGVVSRSVTLDAGWDILGFARQAEGLSAGAVTFRTIPSGTSVLPTPSDGEAVQVFPAQVRAFVANAIAQDAPSRTTTPAPVPSDAAVSRAAQAAPAAPAAPSARSTTTAAPVPAPRSTTPPITAAAPGCIN